MNWCHHTNLPNTEEKTEREITELSREYAELAEQVKEIKVKNNTT